MNERYGARDGRELPEFPEHVVYNFGCSCGWWGIARIPREHQQAACPKRCGEVYVQYRDDDGEWRLSPMVH